MFSADSETDKLFIPFELTSVFLNYSTFKFDISFAYASDFRLSSVIMLFFCVIELFKFSIYIFEQFGLSQSGSIPSSVIKQSSKLSSTIDEQCFEVEMALSVTSVTLFQFIERFRFYSLALFSDFI